MYDLLLLGPDQMSDNTALIVEIVGAVVALLVGIVVITVIIVVVVLAKSRHDKYTTRR